MRRIVRAIGRELDTPVEALRGPIRTRNVTRVRHIAMGCVRRLTHHSYPEIAMYFGGRDHSTVISGCRRFEAAIASGDPDALHGWEVARTAIGPVVTTTSSGGDDPFVRATIDAGIRKPGDA